MARPRLLLHPGTHKTGSTAIQDSLDRNRAWLATQGVAYPRICLPGQQAKKAHHDFAEAVTGSDQVSAYEVEHYLSQIEQAAAGSRLTVLSAEPIYRLTLGDHPAKDDAVFKAHWAYLKHLRRSLNAFDVFVLIYFRRPDRVVESLFKNSISNGRQEVPPFNLHIKQSQWFFDYPRHLELFRDVFDGVEVRSYEAEAEGGLLSRFYSALDLEEPPAAQSNVVRVSHCNRATLWLRRSLSEDAKQPMHRYRTLFAAENGSSPIFAEPQPSMLWPSNGVFETFVERHRSSYEMGLFDLPEPPGRSSTKWTDEMHAAAGCAFAEWFDENEERLRQRDKAGRKKYWELDPD